MPGSVCDLEDPLLAKQRFDLVPGDDVALLKSLYGKVLACVAILGQYDLAEVSTSQDREQSEVLEAHASLELRLTSRLVRGVSILKRSRWSWYVVCNLIKKNEISNRVMKI